MGKLLDLSIAISGDTGTRGIPVVGVAVAPPAISGLGGRTRAGAGATERDGRVPSGILAATGEGSPAAGNGAGIGLGWPASSCPGLAAVGGAGTGRISGGADSSSDGSSSATGTGDTAAGAAGCDCEEPPPASMRTTKSPM